MKYCLIGFVGNSKITRINSSLNENHKIQKLWQGLVCPSVCLIIEITQQI